MRRVACSVLLIGTLLSACGSGPILSRTQDARMNASFACLAFEIVYPTTASHKKIAFTAQQRTDQISPAVGWARYAASRDKKWRDETQSFDALAAAMRTHKSAAINVAVVNVRKVCDPLNTANGITP
jgi:hypothetical protein